MPISQTIIDAAGQYVLTRADLSPGNGFSDTPAIRAPLNPDPVVLVALINRWRQERRKELKRAKAHFVDRLGPNGWQMAPMEGSYNCPLQAAINAGLKQNVDILLQAGANPSGFPDHVFSEHATRFIRFRLPKWYNYNICDTWEKLLSQLPPETPAQLSALTIQEIDARKQEGCISPFWTEQNLPYATMRWEWIIWELVTPLESAVRIGDEETVDKLLNHPHCDIDGWLTSRTGKLDPTKENTASYLSTSTPLHSAVSYRQTRLLGRLLGAQFDPNVLPAATPCSALTPLMLSIVMEPPNLEAFDILVAHRLTDLQLRTPVFNVHLLHFAAAKLDVSLLRHILEHTPGSPKMLVGLLQTVQWQTPLHVACLPLNDSQINCCSTAIWQSIHDVRTTDHFWRPAARTRLRAMDNIDFPDPDPPKYFDEQIAVVELLLDVSSNNSHQQQQELERKAHEIAAQDVHGNTLLHYLAGQRAVNEKLINSLRKLPSVEITWKTCQNYWGFTPEFLWEDGKRALAEKEREYMSMEASEF
ncbi:hypothetical protein PFICI_15006 [Pestalotiopsis fici W106-1]|uniref:Uncharacterized protein n=1 Tax=Pestalotiopsis fici (strain W106-1 / CGMCC3.15140) TaxID=1229662 RepID=W3WKQ3_PESFW|nr:uncharacterized protein PFICI_15006 [Pestalotiopsis fici W106-1]ETS73401.1 hypothetical protein PFICI_15006 [Pestalotiopsis fici W106-1]